MFVPESQHKGVDRNLRLVLSDNLEVTGLRPLVVESLEAGHEGGGGVVCSVHFCSEL